MTTGALAMLHAVDAAPPRALELAVLVVANLCATGMRFVALRTWVFARGRRARRARPEPAVVAEQGA